MPFPIHLRSEARVPRVTVRLSCHFIWNARSGARPHRTDMTLHGLSFRHSSLFVVVEEKPDSLEHDRIYDPRNIISLEPQHNSPFA